MLELIFSKEESNIRLAKRMLEDKWEKFIEKNAKKITKKWFVRGECTFYINQKLHQIKREELAYGMGTVLVTETPFLSTRLKDENRLIREFIVETLKTKYE